MLVWADEDASVIPDAAGIRGRARVPWGARVVTVIVPFLCNTLMNFVIGLLLAKYLGPAEYGRFALALAVAMALQTLFFDWLRLAAIRFYSERTRAEAPHVRATLDASFALLIAGVSAAAVLALLSGFDLKLSHGLVGLAVAACVANGLFDYHTALIRARFLDRAYARLILTKNALSLALTLGGAFLFHSAEMAVAGLCLSMAGSVLMGRRTLSDGEARPILADPILARSLLAYALPVVVANMLYQVIPLTDRAMAASQHGFAVSGQFSLAYDIGFRIASAIGSTLDVLLFQMAVRLDEHHGAERAKEAIGRNMGMVFAVLAPTCAGLWVVVPSFEALLVPAEFQGPFAHYLRLLTPGLFCYALIHWAVNPVFQIGKRTGPLIVAALVASLANAVLLMLMPAMPDASGFAAAQSGALAVGLAALLLFAVRLRPVWPRLRDVGGATAATLAMLAALGPLRGLAPGLATLAAQAATGAVVYGTVALVLDVADARTLLVGLLGPRLRGPVGARLRSTR